MTFDIYAYIPGNLSRLSGVLEEPRVSTISEQDHITESLQYYNIYSNIYTRVKQRKSYNNIVYKIVVSNLTTKFDTYYKPKEWSGIINKHNTQNTHPAQGSHI